MASPKLQRTPLTISATSSSVSARTKDDFGRLSIQIMIAHISANESVPEESSQLHFVATQMQLYFSCLLLRCLRMEEVSTATASSSRAETRALTGLPTELALASHETLRLCFYMHACQHSQWLGCSGFVREYNCHRFSSLVNSFTRTTRLRLRRILGNTPSSLHRLSSK